MHEIEEKLREFPILQSAWLRADQVPFSLRVREICERECPRYNSSWSCPPAVGTVQECEARCRNFRDCFVFSTVSEVDDAANLEQTLALRMEHEEITRQVGRIFRKRYGTCLILSTESCGICARCSWPDAPCRYPEKMFPCVESYGILVSELADGCGLEFQCGSNIVNWFSVIFFNENAEGGTA